MNFPKDAKGYTKLIVPARLGLREQEFVTICFKDKTGFVPVGIFIKFSLRERSIFKDGIFESEGGGHLPSEGNLTGKFIELLATTLERGDPIPDPHDQDGFIFLLQSWINEMKRLREL